jgi:hypothetical protein
LELDKERRCNKNLKQYIETEEVKDNKTAQIKTDISQIQLP